jgi:hypothetical protein
MTQKNRWSQFQGRPKSIMADSKNKECETKEGGC